MALLFGFFFACVLAFLLFLPFLWMSIRHVKKLEKRKGRENITWLDSFPTLLLFAIGIYLAIKGYNFVMDGLADSLNP